MSDTSMSKELSGISAVRERYGLRVRDLEILTLNAMKSAFIHYDERLEIINSVIKPGFAPLVTGSRPAAFLLSLYLKRPPPSTMRTRPVRPRGAGSQPEGNTSADW